MGWPIERKVLWGLGIATAFFCGLGMIAYALILSFVNTGNWVIHSHLVIETMQGTRTALDDAETGVRGYLLTQDAVYLEPYNLVRERIPGLITQLLILTSDNPTQHQRMGQLKVEVDREMEILQQAVEAGRAHSIPPAVQRQLLEEDQRAMTNNRNSFREARLFEGNLLTIRDANWRLNLLEAITAAAILGLLNFVLLGYIYYVFKRDLTERRRAESALRTSEERLRLLIASSKDYAFFMLDPHGKVATWNDGAQIIKGYEAGEIMGRSFSTFFPDEEQRAGKPALILAKAIKEGRAEVEGWRVRKDGSQFWANAITSAVRDEQGRLLGFSEVTRDLTERRAAEEKIHQSQTRLAAILDGSPSVIFVKDPAGQYTLVNRKFEEAFRVKREQVLGMTDMHFFPMDVAQKLREHDVKALESAQAMEFEEVIPQTDGSHIYLSARVPLLGDDHQPYALCGVFTDITERKQSEEEIRRLNRTLQDRVVDRSVELMRAADELKMERAERASVEQSAREVWDRLREVFDRSPVPMLIYDLETLALLEANNSAAALYGSTRPELLKMRMTDLCPMEDVARLGEDVVRGGLSPDSPRTCRHRSKGGQVISVGIIARRIEWEGRRSALAVVITENERHRLQDIALALEAAGPEA